MNLRNCTAIYFLFLISFEDAQSTTQFTVPDTPATQFSVPDTSLFTTTATVSPFSGQCSRLAIPSACKLWDMNVILVLDENTASDTFQAIQDFLNNLTTNCPISSGNSGNSFILLTPSSLDQNVNASKCFSAADCHELIATNMTIKKTFLSATKHDDVIISLFNLSFANFLPTYEQPINRGKVIYFIANLVRQNDLFNLTLQQWWLANYMNKNEIVFEILYLENLEQRSYNEYLKKNTKLIREHPFVMNFGIGNILKVFNDLNEIFTYPNLIMFRDSFQSRQACPYPLDENNSWEYFIRYGIPAVAALITVLCCGCLCFLKAKYKIKLLNLRRREVEVQAIVHANQSSSLHPTASLNSYIEMEGNAMRNKSELNDKWEIAPDALIIKRSEKLGSGAFATVYKGILKGKAPVFDVYENQMFVTNFITNNEVAVKVVPNHTDMEGKRDFLNEIAFMKNLGYHVHVLSLLGCITDPNEPCLVLEYCANGDLLKFLHKHKPNLLKTDSEDCPTDVDYCIRVKDLLSFAWQISDGMEYLSSHDYIHRDVAARNIFVTKQLAAKIGDFGLCRCADQSLYTAKGGRLPIKWMAIESLKQYIYTTKSDVWSFGVLLFELFSLGDAPYPVIQSLDMISHLEAGNRLSRPEVCPENLYDLMKSCWQVEAELRPTFTEIRSKLTLMLDSATEHYGYLDVQKEVEVEEKAEMR